MDTTVSLFVGDILIVCCRCRHILICLFLFYDTDTATRKERADFLQEIDMMKKISEGYNAHIVNMVTL